MSFDRSSVSAFNDRPKGYPYINLNATGSSVQGVYAGYEMTIKREWDHRTQQYTTPQIASDQKVRTSTVLHLFLTGGENFHASVDDDEDLSYAHVKYEIKGGFESATKWREVENSAGGTGIKPGDTIKITRVSEHTKYKNTGVFEFEVELMTEAPSEEVMAATSELRERFKSREQLTVEAIAELSEQSQARTFVSPQPAAQPVQPQGRSWSAQPQHTVGYDTSIQPF